jgi:hypothetical protein
MLLEILGTLVEPRSWVGTPTKPHMELKSKRSYLSRSPLVNAIEES